MSWSIKYEMFANYAFWLVFVGFGITLGINMQAYVNMYVYVATYIT